MFSNFLQIFRKKCSMAHALLFVISLMFYILYLTCCLCANTFSTLKNAQNGLKSHYFESEKI